MSVILVIDDDAGIRDTVQRILTTEGHTVLTAADGNQGILLARREQPDIVLTDLTMPGIDGKTVCEMLRDDPRTRSTRIIAMSAGLTLYESTAGLLADSILAKPFTANLLIANISVQARKRETERLAQSAPPTTCCNAPADD